MGIFASLRRRFAFTGTRVPVFPGPGVQDYDAYWRGRGFAINPKLKPREAVFASWIPATARVLDIGCGTSRLPVVLRDRGNPVTVADVSPMVLEGFANQSIETRVVDLERPEAIALDQRYDVIVLSEVLEHLRYPENALHALKPFGTTFLLSVPNSAYYRYRFGLLFGGRFFTQWVSHPSEHLRFWSHLDFLDWLRAQGGTVRRVEASNGFGGWWMRRFPNLFGHQVCYEVTFA